MYCSDAGWGCMLRTAQMLLANTLARHFKELSVDSILTDDRERQLLRLFRDTTEQSAGFSIHNIAMRGEEYGTRVGEWFGPQVACDVLRDCVQREASVDMSVYVARDATIYRNEVLQLCEQQQGEALLILVPNRLGLSELNDMYLSQLLTVFQQSHSMGIVGGKSNAARYYVGVVDSRDVLYLDPHTVQPVVNMDNAQFSVDSYHPTQHSSMPLCDIDPSLAMAFYCHTRVQLTNLLDQLENIICKKNDFPLLNVAKQPPIYSDSTIINFNMNDDNDDNDKSQNQTSITIDDDDFELM